METGDSEIGCYAQVNTASVNHVDPGSYTEELNQSSEGFIPLKTGLAQDAWLQCS